MDGPAPVVGQADQPVPGRSNLALRIVSALVLAPIALGVAWLGGSLFALFWGAVAIVVLWEWVKLVSGPGQKQTYSVGASALAAGAVVGWLHRPIAALLLIGLGALAAAIFAPRTRRIWITAGIAYAGVMLLAPILLRDDPDFGLLSLLLLFAVVWTTDVLAYFGGRAFGGPKLCPSISPKKTWSGAITGTIAGTAAGVLVAYGFGTFNWIAICAVAFILSVVSQLGDLLESSIKRRFGAKDAGQLIPGHGGVMDRLDGFWAAVLAACLIGILRGGFDAPARGLLVW